MRNLLHALVVGFVFLSVSPGFVLAERWDDLSEEQRERAMRNYRRHQELSPEKRQDVERRYEKWKKLPDAERNRFRERYKEYRGRGLIDD